MPEKLGLNGSLQRNTIFFLIQTSVLRAPAPGSCPQSGPDLLLRNHGEENQEKRLTNRKSNASNAPGLPHCRYAGFLLRGRKGRADGRASSGLPRFRSASFKQLPPRPGLLVSARGRLRARAPQLPPRHPQETLLASGFPRGPQEPIPAFPVLSQRALRSPSMPCKPCAPGTQCRSTFPANAGTDQSRPWMTQ